MLYQLSEIASVAGSQLRGADIHVDAILTDSRVTILHGSPLFIAIKGPNHNGKDYITELYRRGVRAFIVDEAVEDLPEAGFIVTPDPLKALQCLAAHHRNKFKGTVIGITGSNGKTVVKEWFAALLPDGIKLLRSPKSFNSQLGVALSVLMLNGDEDIAIFEAGISHPGEMETLERMIKPDIGVITNIGDAHQENFVDRAQKASEKISLFTGCEVIIYNGRDSTLGEILSHTYPSKCLIDYTQVTYDNLHFKDQASADNIKTVLAIYGTLGIDTRTLLDRASKLQPVAMRLDLREGILGSLIVNDTYNSDIDSLNIALEYISNVGAGRKKTVILSDILQSGFPEEELYGKVSKLLADAGVDTLIGVGETIKKYAASFPMEHYFFSDHKQLAHSIRNEWIEGRIVLLKGSRASKFENIAHLLDRRSHTTTLRVDLDAVIHNLNYYRSVVGSQTAVMAMVKAGGYGHGNFELANILQHQKVDYLAVAFADEGVALREKGITLPIVVLNADSDSFDLMISHSLEPEIYNFTSLASFIHKVESHCERSYPIHIKIDTGMHRLGFEADDIDDVADILVSRRDLVEVRSVFSHLASADVVNDDDFTLKQIERFDESSGRLIQQLGYRPLRHILNSSGIERFSKYKFDMVRLGIGLYGSSGGNENTRPVSVLSSRIVQVKRLKRGETVGYGREGLISSPKTIATVPIGYADGIDRRLGNGSWSFIVNDKKAPTIGRISMDTCAIDITGIEATEGDEVIIFGTEKGNRIEDAANVLGTIPYEIMTGISSRVKRIFIKE